MPASRSIFGKRPIFWALFLGFAATFMAAISLVVWASPDTPQEISSANLTDIARVMAAGVDLPSLVDSTPDEPGLEKVSTVLKAGIAGQSFVDRAYVVLRTKDGSLLRIVEADSQNDRIPPAIPLDHVPPALQRCLSYNVALPSGVPIHRPDGEWLEAYAPICDAEGHVIGAVVTARQDTVSSGLSASQSRWMAVPVAIAVILCLVLAWTLDENFASRSAGAAAWLQPRPVRAFLEAAVILSVVAVMGQTVWRNVGLSEQRERRAHSATSLRALCDSLVVLSGLQTGTSIDDATVDRIAKRLTETGLDPEAQHLRQVAASTTNTQESAANIKELLGRLVRKEQELTEILAVGTLEENKRSQDLYQTLIVTSAVALAALILMRFVGEQQRSLAEVTQDRNETRARYERVVEGLPVGLFVIEDGILAFTNDAWRHLFGSEPGLDDMALFQRAVHPEDLPEVSKVLRDAELRGKPFEIQYRILSGGKLCHIESQGTPVYDKEGVCRQLLGFTLDVSTTVEAKLAIQRTFAEIENKNRLLGAALGELEMNLENVVRSLVRAVEAKDPYTAGHSERVKTYSLWLGEKVGLSKYEMRVLELGTLVHDVGKIGTPDAILTKPGRLTAEEYDIIKLHPTFGVKIIESIGLFRDCLPIVRWHHEKLNGAGYPDGLQGDEIPYLVRISTIADIFDAMTSTRAYRHGMAVEEVLALMSGMTDKGELDPVLFATFIQVIMDRGVICHPSDLAA